MKAALCSALCLLPLLLGRAHAEEPKLDIGEQDPQLSALANTRWAMVLPERDFEGGCIMGFLAFRFSPTGYFTYNNRVQGSWRLDELGNVRLKTRNGIKFMLLVEDDKLKVTQNLPFLKRTNVFQKCPSE